MAKKSEKVSLAKDVKFSPDILLKILIGLLFICIGIQGTIGESNNQLFKALNNEVIEIILGVILIISGLLMIVPIFMKGINATYTKISMIIVLAVWVLTIFVSDFYYGFNHTNGTEWFSWIENFIYHLLILSCVYKVSAGALKK